MTSPVRLQLSRASGFNLQALSISTNGLTAIKVDRSSPFGNHYRVEKDRYAIVTPWLVTMRGTVVEKFDSNAEAIEIAVRRFEADVTQTGPHNHRRMEPVPTPVDIIKALRGRNLACWCEPGAPCHADILLRIANGPLCEAVR